MRLDRVDNVRAVAFGLYPSMRAASSTLARVSSLTLAPGVKVRLTADCDTDAKRATSTEVTGLLLDVLSRRCRAAAKFS